MPRPLKTLHCTKPQGSVNRIVLKFVAILLWQNGLRQDNMVLKKFPRFIDKRREEQDTGRVALMCGKLPIYKS